MRFRAGFVPALLMAFSTAFLSVPSEGQTSVPGKPRLGGTLRVKPMAGSFAANLDPAESTSPFILDQLYDGLVRLDKYFNIVPSLAEYWVISDSGKKFTFFLRKDARFHNGRELTAEDVKFSLERLLRKGIGTLYFQSFKGKVVGADEYSEGKAAEVTGFKVINRTTFEIDWRDPYASGLFLLTTDFCKILPRDLVLSQGAAFFMKPSGTGPFKFAGWLRSPRFGIEGVRLEKNDDYFGETPYLDAVEFSPYFTVDQFKSGEVHIIPLPQEGIDETRYEVLDNDSLDIIFLGLSCDIPPFDKKEVRQALALALDKEKIARAAYSPESVPRPIDEYIPADLPGFFPVEPGRRPDPVKAAALLAGAGFGPEKPFPEVLLRMPWSKKDIHMRIFREMKRQLEAVNIGLDYEYIQSLRHDRPKAQPFFQIFEWVMDFPDAENIILPVFQSQSFLNKVTMNFSDPALDGLLAASEVEAGWEKRTDLFRKMAALLQDDVPAIPLYRLRFRLALQPYVQGAQASPMGFNNLDVRDVWFDR
jgi:ABC-type transport system substrate-binding protein